MKLLKNVITKRIEVFNQLELNHKYIKSIWHFYSIYNICLVLTGIYDPLLNEKNRLYKKLLESSYKKLDMKKLGEMYKYLKNDMKIISKAMEEIELKEESEGIFGDYDIPDMVAISIHD